MKKTAINELVGEYTFKKFGLDKNNQYDITSVRAIDLLTPNRIDLIAKYEYLVFKQNAVKSNLAEEVYKSHLDVFSDGGFYEPGSDTKNSYEDFVKEYDDIYDSLKERGFDSAKSLIPIGNDGVIINGGHRTAASIFLNQEVSVLEIPNHSGPKYNYKYFERSKMPREYLDFLALNYVKLAPRTTFVICLWPKAVKMNKTKECEALIEKKTKVIYKRVLPLTKMGLKNLMMHLYHKEQWVGAEKNNFMGTYGKVDACYAKADTILYLVEADSLATIIDLKNQIRSVFGIDKRSVHITDTREEAIYTVDLALNSHSVLAMNCGYPDKLNAKLKKLEEQFAKLKNKNVVLNPLYTLLYFGHDVKITEEDDFVSIKELKKDVVYDTRNFFTYRGFKLLSPEYAKEISPAKYAAAFDSIIKKDNIPTKAKVKEGVSKVAFRAKRKTKVTLKKLGLLKYVDKLRGKKS